MIRVVQEFKVAYGNVSGTGTDISGFVYVTGIIFMGRPYPSKKPFR